MAANPFTWIRKAIDLAKQPRVKLNSIQDLPGAKKNVQRVGRGPGSGRGKTCGHGHKGQVRERVKERERCKLGSFRGNGIRNE
jgi:large subunit ribosomal protein L15